jgi:sugar lactone lactonase YvrE
LDTPADISALAAYREPDGRVDYSWDVWHDLRSCFHAAQLGVDNRSQQAVTTTAWSPAGAPRVKEVPSVNRREALWTLFALLTPSRLIGAKPAVSTLIGTGAPGYSDRQVNNPYGLVLGPDRALYFCDLDNQRIRRLDLKTRRITTVAGDGQKAYRGDGGPATQASLNMPHEIQFDAARHLYIAERDNHVIRKVDAKTGIISTFAGTGVPGFSGDGGPATEAQLRQPHSIAVDRAGRLLICDIGNHRVRQVDLSSRTIETYGGTGERQPTPDGAPVKGSPLNGPRTIAFDRDGTLYLALREGNAIYRVTRKDARIHHLAGTGDQGYSGDGGQARLAKFAGPKGLACAGGRLYVADTENHVVRRIELETGIITTVLGTGQRGDGPEPDPLRCALSRPHGVLVDATGVLYIGDSEAHRIRVVQ